MHTQKLNEILDFKVMGHDGYDQTACLAVAGQSVAEERFGYQFDRRNLTRKRKRTDKNQENKKDSTAN